LFRRRASTHRAIFAPAEQLFEQRGRPLDVGDREIDVLNSPLGHREDSWF
jgi:hypothetical protein